MSAQPRSTTSTTPKGSIGDCCRSATWPETQQNFQVKHCCNNESTSEDECQPHLHQVGLVQPAFVSPLPEHNGMMHKGAEREREQLPLYSTVSKVQAHSDLGVVRSTIAIRDLGKVLLCLPNPHQPPQLHQRVQSAMPEHQCGKKHVQVGQFCNNSNSEAQCQPHRHQVGLVQPAFVSPRPESDHMIAQGAGEGEEETTTIQCPSYNDTVAWEL